MTSQPLNAPNTVDPDEVAKFSAMASEWWDPAGKFKPLHKFNPIRLAYIRETLCTHFSLDDNGPTPLRGLRVLDLGCGGGLLSEPVSRMGAELIGADASAETIETARVHADQQGLTIDYRVTRAEELAAQSEAFDAIICMEVVEHVADLGEFIKTCAQLLKPGGIILLATLNRTMKSYAFAIVGAEYILRWLPAGTHVWEKFVKPDELESFLAAVNLATDKPLGLSYNPLSDHWCRSTDVSVNYVLSAVKANNE